MKDENKPTSPQDLIQPIEPEKEHETPRPCVFRDGCRDLTRCLKVERCLQLPKETK